MNQRNVRGNTLSDISRRLVEHAARRAPLELSERLREEWLADLASRASGPSRLQFAVGCCWASRVITLEYAPAVAVVAADPKAVNALLPTQLDRFSRRSVTFLAVICLHAGLFYAVITHISDQHRAAIPTPLENQPVRTNAPPPVAIPIPDPVTQPTIIVKRPEYELQPERETTHDVTTAVQEDVGVPTAAVPKAAPVHEVSEVAGGPGAGFPNPDEYYPSAAKYMQEQGVASIRVCVDVRGRLTTDPVTLQGSGSPRLDEGALRLARAASGHYRPTTRDGQAVDSCYPLRIRFQLR
jgi:periplasmic protein TonB